MASQGWKRSTWAGLAAVAVVATTAAPAAATPPPPGNASDAAKQLQALSHDAEILTEDFKKAQDDHAARQKELEGARAEAGRAEQAAQGARAEQERFRSKVDKLTEASYKGAQMNQMSALLVSKSPNDFLDRASTLDSLAKDNNDAIKSFTRATSEAEKAERQTKAARDHATRAEADSARIEGEMAGRKAAMDGQIAKVKQQYNSLSSKEKGELSGGGTSVGAIGGAGAAVAAVNAALGEQGKPYVYGAKGPDEFDCSGLVQYAYKKAGVSLSGSTKTQVSEGQGVSQSSMKPGDAIFFYSGPSHVGIYIGGGKMVHAPTEGQDVKVEDYKEVGDITAVRRYAN
jgi:cell wall-associated NlpC family hydrolase